MAQTAAVAISQSSRVRSYNGLPDWARGQLPATVACDVRDADREVELVLIGVTTLPETLDASARAKIRHPAARIRFFAEPHSMDVLVQLGARGEDDFIPVACRLDAENELPPVLARASLAFLGTDSPGRTKRHSSSGRARPASPAA